MWRMFILLLGFSLALGGEPACNSEDEKISDLTSTLQTRLTHSVVEGSQGGSMTRSTDTDGGEPESSPAAPICPNDADDEAGGFWEKYFEDNCHVAPGDIPKELKTALQDAEMTPEVAEKKVRCVVSAGSTLEASNLVFEVEEADDISRNWKYVDGSAKLLVMDNGKVEIEPADADTHYPGPCAVFKETVPRTVRVDNRDFTEVLKQVRKSYKKVCPESYREFHGPESKLYSESQGLLGRKEVVGGGLIEWEVVAKVSGVFGGDVNIRYTESAPGDRAPESKAQVLTLVETIPNLCVFCGSCDPHLVSMVDEDEDPKFAEVEHTSSESVKDIQMRLAELRARRDEAQKNGDARSLLELAQETSEWRAQLHAVRGRQASAKRQNPKFFGRTHSNRRSPVKPQQSHKDGELFFGDNFHDKVLPHRTVEEHKAVQALSAALVHLVNYERGGKVSTGGEANLLENGGFEQVTGNPHNAISSPDSLGKWVVLRGTVNAGRFSTNYNLPMEGSSLLHLCGDSQLKGAIAQDFQTQVGVEYQVAFSYAASAEGGGGQGVEVTINSGREEKQAVFADPRYTCSTGGDNHHNCWAWQYLQWHRHKFRFTAGSNTTTLEIESTVNRAGCFLLDDVFVNLPPFHNLPKSYSFFETSANTKCWFAPYSQGKCGSCWAFASIGALEKQYCMRASGQARVSLSREMLVRCSARNNACGGGNADKAYGDLMEIGGLWQTKCLPYQGDGSKHCPAFAYSWFGQAAVGKTGKFARIDQEIQENCDDLRRFSNRPPLGVEWDLPFTMIYAQRTGRLPDYNNPALLNYRRYFAKARSHGNVPSWWLTGEEAMIAALVKYGAIYASFKVYNDFTDKPPIQRICDDHCWPFGQMYGEDKYPAKCGCGCSGHAIQIIGYGEEVWESGEVVPYWQIENSWGGGGHMDLFNGEPGDPFSYEHPANAEDQCILAVGVSGKSEGLADGWEFLLWVDGKLIHLGNVTGKQILSYPLALQPGNHSITFEVHAKEHKKVRGMDVEAYSVFMPMLRCRGRGFRYDFLRNIDKVELSWNKETKAELMARADELLSQNGIDPNTASASCPSRCKQGRFSSTQPCVGYLVSWGDCRFDQWYTQHMEFNCTLCDEEVALIDKKARLIHQLPNETFVEWYRLIHEALNAPGEPGWNNNGYHCVIGTAGHSPYSRLNATYRFAMPERSSCDQRHTAMLNPIDTSLKVFARPDGNIENNATRTISCPVPLAGEATLQCNDGVLRVQGHTCRAQHGMNIAARGYYRMVRGVNYHGIESGAAFAIAELGVSSNICPTQSWTRWTLCSSVQPCEKGVQNRTREPRPPLTIDSPECSGVIFQESRPCARPGFCPQVLARFSARGASSVDDFLTAYPGSSTQLPVPTAGAHILESIYTPCDTLMHWCSLITGNNFCTVLFMAQFEVHRPGKYLMEFSGSGLGSSSQFIFSSDRDRDAALMSHFKIHVGADMQEWADKGELHRRRRAGKGGSEWRPATEVAFRAGKYPAYLLLTGWRQCPSYMLSLHNREHYFPATVFGKAREEGTSDFSNYGPWIRVYHNGYHLVKKLYNTNWTFTGNELYATLGIDQYSDALSSSSVTIKGQTVLPGEGRYKVEVRTDVECKAEQLWSYCLSDSRRRWTSTSLRITDPSRDHQGVHRRRNSVDRSGYENIALAHIVDVSGESPVEFEATFRLPSDAGKRVEIQGVAKDTTYESVPVPGHYVLPNTIEIVWAKYIMDSSGSAYHSDPHAVDMGADIQYHSDIGLVRGSDLTRVTYPDRDLPFANEYQIQPFNETPPGVIVLGTENLHGFVAVAEGRVDAGACISLQAEMEHNGSENMNGTLRGLGLQMCDIDGDRQYLELFQLLHGAEGAEQLGWLHVEFQHPTHLRLMRDVATRKLDIGYRPDNRAAYARVWDSFQELLPIHDSFWSRPLTVGVSMGTERPYRWAEFYNISIDECPHTCADATGHHLLCGQVTTPCGGQLNCSAGCDDGESCIKGHCFTCPPESAEQKNWTCGHRNSTCVDHEGRVFEKFVPVGEGCTDRSYCGSDHQCHCEAETKFSLMAMGWECGTMPDECGGNVSLEECQFQGSENSVCENNRCSCIPNDFTRFSDWNCGMESSGCGPMVVFGNHGGACLEGQLCKEHVCCTVATWPADYECGAKFDTCLGTNVTFTKARSEWELIFKQTAPHMWPYSRWYSTGTDKADNFARYDYWDWRKNSISTDYLDANEKFTLKLQYEGSDLPAGNNYNIWKQLEFPGDSVCSGPEPGYEAVVVNMQPDASGFHGMCRSYTHLLEGHSTQRRRRFPGGFKMVAGQRTSTNDGILTPFEGKNADSVELYALKTSIKDGSCPFANGQCTAEHTCVCNPSSPPVGAQCGIFNDGCGSITTMNYTGDGGNEPQLWQHANGPVQPGRCPTGYMCNMTTLRCVESHTPPIDSMRGCLSHDVERLSQYLGHVYNFRDGTYRNYIYDGGHDMYDVGNRIQIRAGSSYSVYLTYTNQCSGQWTSAGVSDVKYFTCKITTPVSAWFAGFKSDSNDITGFQVSGNLGADGYGSVSANSDADELGQWEYGSLWGYFKQVYGTNNPSINQLVLVPQKDWSNTFSTSTNNGQHAVEGTTSTSVGMLLYVMFAGWEYGTQPRAVHYSTSDFQKVMQSVVDSC